MNWLKQLFGRRPQHRQSSVIRGPGQSGKEYPYEIRPLDAVFRPLPGNYICARPSEDGSWVPLYVAQTRDLHQRLEGHVTVEDAVAQGATHIHVHYCTAGQAARCTEERDLILRWQPICDDPLDG